MDRLMTESPNRSKRMMLAKAYQICKLEMGEKKKDFVTIFTDFAEEVREDLVPMDLLNVDTGEYIRGKVSVSGTNQPLIPVVSTDVKGMGIYGNELLVQFHNTKGTYRYALANNVQAQEVFKTMYTSGSKGKWLWKNIRGHVKGQPKPYNWGMSYGGPGLTGGSKPKVPTIGGTTASLIPYRIGKRTPIGKLGTHPNFEKMAKVLKQYKRDPISMVQQVGIEPTILLGTMERMIMRMTGQVISVDVPSVAKKVAKAGKFKQGAQVIQGVQELRARNTLKKLQPGNVIKGVI